MGDDARTADVEVDLTAEERADIDGMYVRVANATYYELLGVPRTAERRAIRDAYFALSKRFHPDVYFGRKLGGWHTRTEMVFREITRAYDTLSNKKLRADYDAQQGRSSSPRIGGSAASIPAASPSPPASPAEPPAPTPASPSAATGPATALATQPVGSSSADLSGERPVIPQSAPPGARAVSQTHMPAVHPRPATQPPPAGVTIGDEPSYRTDPEAARKAARDALARRFARATSMPPTGRSSIIPNPTGAASGSTSPASSSAASGTGSAPSVTLESLRLNTAPRAPVDGSGAQRVARLLQMAQEALAANRLVEYANLTSMAAQADPQNSDLQAQSDEATRKMATAMADTFISQARSEEAAGRWERAADLWQKAALGRPRDASLLDRAANAMLNARMDGRKAAELARRATQLDPRSARYFTTLGQVFISAGLKASAIGALESAAALEPNSASIKELIAKAKAIGGK